MVWTIPSYSGPWPEGKAFDFALLAEGFKRLQEQGRVEMGGGGGAQPEGTKCPNPNCPLGYAHTGPCPEE